MLPQNRNCTGGLRDAKDGKDGKALEDRP